MSEIAEVLHLYNRYARLSIKLQSAYSDRKRFQGTDARCCVYESFKHSKDNVMVGSCPSLEQPALHDFKHLKKFLKFHHPTNLLIPGRVAQHPGGDPFQAPKYAHKDGQWTWQRSDEEDWSACTMFGILLRSFVVIDIDGKDFIEDYERIFPALTRCPKEHTKKGAHYFFLRTELCDELRFYDCARAMKGRGDAFPTEPSGVLPVDIKTVCSTGTAGFLIVTPSTGKSWVHNKELWNAPLKPIPDDMVRTFANLKETRKGPAKEGPAKEESTFSFFLGGQEMGIDLQQTFLASQFQMSLTMIFQSHPLA